MAKTVNTSPQSKARATLPLLERLRRVLEHFMQPHTRAKKTKSKGLLALLQLLCQYSMGAGYMPLAMGVRKPVFSVVHSALGAAPPVLTPIDSGNVKPMASTASVLGAPYRQKDILQNMPALSGHILLAASTAQAAAESTLQFTHPQKSRQNTPKNAADILAYRPFSVLPHTPSLRASGGKLPMPQMQAERGGAALTVRMFPRPQQVQRQRLQRHIQAPESASVLEKTRYFQDFSIPKQDKRVAFSALRPVAVPDKDQPVVPGMMGVFLPSSPLMRAAIQPVVALARPTLATQGQETSSSPFATPSPHPAPMPPRVAMQGLGGGDSATLAALSTLGSI